MAWQQKPGRKFGRPPGLDELQVTPIIQAVDLVSYDGMSGVREVHADLVHPPGFRKCTHDTESAAVGGCESESLFHPETGESRRAIRVNRLFQVDFRRPDVTFTKNGRINSPLVCGGPTPDNREVFLSNSPPLHLFAEGASGAASLCYQCEPTRLTVETVDQRDLPPINDFVCEQIAEAIPQCVRLPRLTGVGLQERRLINDEKIGILINDLKTGRDLRRFRMRNLGCRQTP